MIGEQVKSPQGDERLLELRNQPEALVENAQIERAESDVVELMDRQETKPEQPADADQTHDQIGPTPVLSGGALQRWCCGCHQK